jgi:uncharacterized protein (TIGR03000 family)
MYSVILMAAMTAGGDAPACHYATPAVGCYGCYGSGYGYGAYYGGYHSCYGGSCYGGAYYPAYSNCYGCYGSCFGYNGPPSSMCYGGCGGCWGGFGTYTYTAPAGSYSTPVITTPTETLPPATPKKEEMKKDETKKGAKVIIDVPATAKLYVDDQLTIGTGTRRVFSTPALVPGQAYYYQLRVEYEQDGKTVTETRRLIVRNGETAQTAFAGSSESRTLVDAGKR